nr:ribonuclease H-like domain-containing protein [Tanacetum cinerariifolium]
MSWVSCSCTAASSVTLVLIPLRVVSATSSATSLGSIQVSLIPDPIFSALHGIYGNGDDNGVSGDGGGRGIAKNLSASSLVKDSVGGWGKFEQWQFKIQQYLQHEHYALWEVIEFGDSYKVPASFASTATTDTASDGTGKKKGRTVTVTTKDIQKRKNDVKARTTLLMSLPDEHQLRFSKYKTAQELWAAILKTFGGNEATKKTKKNLLKQQYDNFKAEGSEILEQTFNRLQVIVSQLQFMDVEIEQDDLNQKFLTSLAPEWLMHMISHVPFEDINQIDEDDMKELDIKWNMALLSMRADKFWKKTGKKISIQGTDVAGFDKLKVEGFNCHKMGHFARECRAPRSQDRGSRDNYR